MFTIRELTDAVLECNPVEAATQRGWSYGIRGFEDKPVTDLNKKFVVILRF